jgi:hypothetical protein
MDEISVKWSWGLMFWSLNEALHLFTNPETSDGDCGAVTIVAVWLTPQPTALGRALELEQTRTRYNHSGAIQGK